MKTISFAVPCFNSEAYMRRCIDSLLPGREAVEILIVDDGSTDATGAIADEYARRYPAIVRALHQENGGHGAGVNRGLSLARGRYFKVVDSDDWLDAAAYQRLLETLQRYEEENDGHKNGPAPDLVVCNYVYDHLEESKTHTVHYRNVFPKDRLCSWRELGRFAPSQYLVMHALIFRTELLRKSGVVLPEHTFYVDNLFASWPLPYVERILYLDLELYHYYLGRKDQSVNENVLKERIDEQIRVTGLVMECTNLDEVAKRYPRLAKYLCRNISVMMAISSIHLLLIGTPEAYRKRRKLWNAVKKGNPALYRRLRYRCLSGWTNLPGHLGGRLTLCGYRLANRIYHFQ